MFIFLGLLVLFYVCIKLWGLLHIKSMIAEQIALSNKSKKFASLKLMKKRLDYFLDKNHRTFFFAQEMDSARQRILDSFKSIAGCFQRPSEAENPPAAPK